MVLFLLKNCPIPGMMLDDLQLTTCWSWPKIQKSCNEIGCESMDGAESVRELLIAGKRIIPVLMI